MIIKIEMENANIVIIGAAIAGDDVRPGDSIPIKFMKAGSPLSVS